VDVHWLEQNAKDVPSGDWWLSETEHAHLGGLHIPKRRDDWRLGRWTAKYAAAIHLNLARNEKVLRTVELRATPSGSPEVLLHSRAALIQLSLSHSGGVGLCTIARAGAELGCDLELVEPRSPVFLADYFTAEEQELVAATPSALRDQLVTLMWSIKESVLKALGCGLRADTRSVNAAPAGFPQTPGGEWNPVSAHTSGRNFCGWWRISCGLVRTVIADPAPRRPVALQAGERAERPKAG
jgi:4'-phosphopantetheinyl transferase